MSYLIEFQRQQKALKDAEKERKKNASSMLNKYRGSEQDIKNGTQLKALKDADRDNKKKASEMLNNYRGTEEDFKNDTQLKALKDADRNNKKKASEMLSKYKGGDGDIKMKNDMQLKAIKNADRDQKNDASSMLHKFRGGDDDIKMKNDTQLKAIKDADRDNKNTASNLLHGYKGGEHDVKEYERTVINDRAREKSTHRSSFSVSAKSDPEGSERASESAEIEAVSKALEDTEIVEAAEDVSISNVSESEVEIVEEAAEEVVEEDESNEADETQSRGRGSCSGKAFKNYERSLSNSPGSLSKKTKKLAGKSRKALSIEFQFGIILPDDEFPDESLCKAAASAIIPHVIKQWTNETNIFCNPKAPEVTGDIVEDDWYDGEDDVRYKVKGKVPVQVFAESSEKEVAEGLGKVLKRRASFRPLDDDAKVSPQETVIGDGDEKWIRVRDGRLGALTF
eukprot:CAMPEP_0197268548 /NCGR_PEP_ID=MMETSP1432-20130617/4242_1 /TAXON_ID=44447 /ORGANISM="Pseudo-nitzschia delicatissima, Strain UNC1205" /LENGTH=452 /DNA_ID=CAMNT_0042733611 /DNA_START=5 /DNA_END=1363 /DNA_ORIENTATION=-